VSAGKRCFFIEGQFHGVSSLISKSIFKITRSFLTTWACEERRNETGRSALKQLHRDLKIANDAGS